LGAAAGYTRSDETPWAYELSYVALIYNFGLVGFICFAAGGVYVLVALIKLIRDRCLPQGERTYAACFLAGLVAFLIANGTNPYLAKFDYVWVFFVPLAYIRLYSVDRDELTYP